MTNGEEIPESLRKLDAANDGLHEAVNGVLKDDSFIVYNKCAAAEHLRKAFALIDTAKSILGWKSEQTPPPPPAEPPNPEVPPKEEA